MEVCKLILPDFRLEAGEGGEPKAFSSMVKWHSLMTKQRKSMPKRIQTTPFREKGLELTYRNVPIVIRFDYSRIEYLTR